MTKGRIWNHSHRGPTRAVQSIPGPCTNYTFKVCLWLTAVLKDQSFGNRHCVHWHFDKACNFFIPLLDIAVWNASIPSVFNLEQRLIPPPPLFFHLVRRVKCEWGGGESIVLITATIVLLSFGLNISNSVLLQAQISTGLYEQCCVIQSWFVSTGLLVLEKWKSELSHWDCIYWKVHRLFSSPEPPSTL